MAIQLIAVLIVHAVCGWKVSINDFNNVAVVSAGKRAGILVMLYIVQAVHMLMIAGALRTMYLWYA
jgi:hypothetical protein